MKTFKVLRDFTSRIYGDFRVGTERNDVPDDAVASFVKQRLVMEVKRPAPLAEPKPETRTSSASRRGRASRQTTAIESGAGESPGTAESLSLSDSLSDGADGPITSTAPMPDGGEGTAES